MRAVALRVPTTKAALLKTRPDATRFGDEIAGLEMLAVALTHVATDEYE